MIAMSSWFYCYFSVSYFFLLLGSVILNYALCHKLWQTDQNITLQAQTTRKRILIFGIVCNLGVLFVFKYLGFFLENVRVLFQGEFQALTLLLPLGISFYTFQEISFLADTYRGETPPTKLVDFMLFILFFPQLIAGPIISHENLLPNIRELKREQADPDEIAGGIYLFCFGLFKKTVLADSLGKSVAYGFENMELMDSGAAILIILAAALQLYLDFSGYSDMAIGLGRLFGFVLPMNFDRPFLTPTIVDFWKRWHMTLTNFLTKNVYIPLGGNRKGRVRTYINLFLVFFISGLWHGASWNYIFWGVLNGITYIITKIFWKQIHKIPTLILTVLNFVCVTAFLGVFRCENFRLTQELYGRLFSFSFTGLHQKFVETFRWPEIWYVIKILKLDTFGWANYACMAAIAIFLLFFLLFAEKKQMQAGRFIVKNHMAVLAAFMFVWSVISLSSVSVFLYFNF